MKLTIPERFTLTRLIPAKGSFETMAIIKSLIEMLYPSEEELKKYDVKQEIIEDKEYVRWNILATVEEVEIPLTEVQIALFVKILEELSKAEQIEYNQYLLYIKLKAEKPEKKNGKRNTK